jgi:small subunit ribosomal protein S16
MLAIRMQRTGRSGHAQFRLIVQESRRAPTSGRVVAHLGHYDPHTKKAVVNKEKAVFYLKNGAQPSERSARLLKAEGVKLPDWVRLSEPKSRGTRNPEKLRKNQEPGAESAEKPESDIVQQVSDDNKSDETQPDASAVADSTATDEETAKETVDVVAPIEGGAAENQPDEAQTIETPTDDSGSVVEEPVKSDTSSQRDAEEKPKT